MKIDDIRELINLMKENQIAEIDLEQEGEKLRIVAGGNNFAVLPAPDAAPPINPAALPATIPEDHEEAEQTIEADAAATINSPIVGTFYNSPSPDDPAFVSVGDEVDDDTVLCIVEAMKVMNEIKAEVCGTILEVLVKNSQPVEFGQPLFRIQPVV